ncbi:hypothetical protein HYV79_04955 [Candidatus Woesearchaeota archaeon]|nr:hypothetical protein [Candidatus Woesearchaeota archaeon]
MAERSFQIQALYYTIYISMALIVIFLVRQIPDIVLSKDIQTHEIETFIYNERIYQSITPFNKILKIPDYEKIILDQKHLVKSFPIKKRAFYIKYDDNEILLNPEDDPYFYDNRRALAPITYGLLQDARIKQGKPVLIEQVYEYE